MDPRTKKLLEFWVHSVLGVKMVRRQGFLFGCYATNLLNRHEVILRELLHFCRFERNLRDLEALPVYWEKWRILGGQNS